MNKNNMNMKRQQRFIKVVSRRMAKAGFECKMVDSHFIVIMDGKPFEVEMWDTPGWGRRRVHFNLSFAFDGTKKNDWGVTTPAYICIDDLQIAE